MIHLVLGDVRHKSAGTLFPVFIFWVSHFYIYGSGTEDSGKTDSSTFVRSPTTACSHHMDTDLA